MIDPEKVESVDDGGAQPRIGRLVQPGERLVCGDGDG
jgi:hypothetical protein